MTRRANATIIGFFIVGAAILAIAAALLFGSGLLRDKYRFVMFFNSSVKGLDVGAPVYFRGVKIGTVNNIGLLLEPKTLKILIPVYVELEVKRISLISGEKITSLRMQRMDEMIKQGLRAQLQSKSLLTGQLVIQLDMYPDKPMKLVGAVNKYPEIPTIPTPIQQLTRKLNDYPVDQVLDNLANAVAGIDRLANNPDLPRAVQHLDETLQQYKQLAGQLDNNAGQITHDLNLALRDLRTTLEASRDLIESGQGLMNDSTQLVQQLQGDADRLSRSAAGTLGEMRNAAGNANNFVSPDSQLYAQLSRTLEEVAKTARSLRLLADTLEQNPEALLKGKSAAGGQ